MHLGTFQLSSHLGYMFRNSFIPSSPWKAPRGLWTEAAGCLPPLSGSHFPLTQPLPLSTPGGAEQVNPAALCLLCHLEQYPPCLMSYRGTQAWLGPVGCQALGVALSEHLLYFWRWTGSYTVASSSCTVFSPHKGGIWSRFHRGRNPGSLSPGLLGSKSCAFVQRLSSQESSGCLCLPCFHSGDSEAQTEICPRFISQFVR